MSENRQNKQAVEQAQAVERAKDLFGQRKEIFSLPAEKALERILDAKQPAALVHSFPEEDLYFLIHDIGVEDSLPLLSLASNRQWEYILDIEAWERDRVDLKSVTRWFDLFFQADADRFVGWFLDQKTEFVEFYLFKNIEVRVRKHDQDPSDFGEGFFTLDDTFYVRITGHSLYVEPGDHESDNGAEKHLYRFLPKFIERLAADNHTTYQQVLLETLSIIPAELEEETYRLKNVRLAEKGFLPFDEAIGIYQYLSARDLGRQCVKATEHSDRNLPLPVPLYSTGMLKEDNLFTNSLKRMESDDAVQQIQIDFAGLCNQAIAADRKRIREKKELENVVRKVCGYINIGLEQLAREERDADADRIALLIQKYPISQIFRVGYGHALELKWQAERWRKKCWFAKEGLPLSFWGEEWLGVLGGLLIKKPLFYDNYKTGLLYKEFTSTDDIRKTEKILNEIIAFDDLLSLITVKLKPVSDGFLTHKNIVLTLWVRDHLGLSEELLPLTLDEFKRFFGKLWSGEKRPRKIDISMKESFLNWLSGRTGLSHYRIVQRVGQAMEDLFDEIESEYGRVSRKELTPRYIHLFLVAS